MSTTKRRIWTLYHEEITPQQIDTDFLVVGAGVAGLRAAIELAEAGRVLVLAKDSLQESSSEYAQGGIAAALSDDDQVSLHEQDTLLAGDGLCKPEAVHILVEEGPEDIEQLIAWGAEFDKEGTKLAFGREGAHSRNRILHAQGDSTGREIVRALYHKTKSLESVDVRSFAGVTELLRNGDGVCGALALGRDGERIRIRSRAVLLATGGLGRIYENTTNPDVATGDGVALAWRAGAVISDIEFVQFHPTALCVEGAPRFLLSEALRGEGAVLRNIDGQRFTVDCHELAELAPRDVVARCIVNELRRTSAPYVLLDLSHREPGFVQTRFPRIYKTCKKLGIDLQKEAAPVHPAAHYAMGGVETDLDGRTNIPRLLSAGETACVGVHGANRLASNSLLEGLVYGRRAGQAMRETAGFSAERADSPGEFLIPQASERELRSLAWRACGILREGAALRAAIEKLASIPMQAAPAPTRAQHELRNIHTVLDLIARCALAREESRGAHYRSDFPEKKPEPLHSHIERQSREVRFA